VGKENLRTYFLMKEVPLPLVDGVQYRNHTPVGSWAANGFGLYDVNGNVAEWCRDVRVRLYEDSPESGDGETSVRTGTHRIERGGHFMTNNEWIAHVGFRGWRMPETIEKILGFRTARPLDR
ncbi:MAG TPA: SUMF1/EgtB/PvdO family nonheme iron enzyme, partial [Planctomycetota bacterium]